MPAIDLHGKVAIVTGGSRGIGEAIARAFVAAGAAVVIASRKQENVQPVADQLNATGGRVLAVACHTGDRSQVRMLVQRTIETFGKVDIAVNNAGTNPHYGPLLEASEEQLDKTLQVNLKGYFFLCQEAAPGMVAQGGGKIINIASVAGLHPAANMGVYSMTKAAVLMMTRSLAQELAAHNVQVNAIAPGVIKTKFATALWSNEKISTRIQRQVGRIGEPDDVVGAALFLATSASNYVNGTVMVIDGGVGVQSQL
ncbi:MAG: SDR family oxidoreductase [Herpetosiphon sp.]